MTISSYRPRALLAFIPFGYLATTRLKSFRDLAYLIATSWVPPLWILVRVEGSGPLDATVSFLLGTLAFISLYELGYLANDAWDAARHPDGRQRAPFKPGVASAALFTAIRLVVWALLAVRTGWLHEPLWIAGQIALIAVMALHNGLTSAALRLASFSQLAVLRFCLPVSALLSASGWAVALASALILYLPLRLLAYADSKNLLAMPERKQRYFAVLSIALCLPLVALVGAVLTTDAILEIWLWLVVAHAGWALIARQTKGANR